MDDRTVAVIGYDGAELLDIACVTSSLDFANRVGAAPEYRVLLATPGGRSIRCDSGLRLNGDCHLERLTDPLEVGDLGRTRSSAGRR